MTRLLAATVVACGLLVANAHAAPPPTITAGTLTVGVSMPSDGFQVGVVDGSRVIFAAGLEIDLANELAGRLELTSTTLLQSAFGDLLAPGAKPWDAALAQVAITKARGRNVDFSTWYMRVDQGVLLSQYIERTPRSRAGLRALRLCAQKGSSGARAIRRRVKPSRKPLLIDDVPDLMLDLQLGRCDAVVDDLPSLATAMAHAPRRYGALAGVIRTRERYGVVLPQGSELKRPINGAIRTMRTDGTIARLERKWLEFSTAKVRVLK
jgi:polar amino acid transport system substrate-binding protein